MLPTRTKLQLHTEPPVQTVDTQSVTADPILISEQQVLFSTAAAAALAPAPGRRPRTASVLLGRLRQVRIRLPEPRPVYPRREASYLQAARMSREIGHL